MHCTVQLLFILYIIVAASSHNIIKPTPLISVLGMEQCTPCYNLQVMSYTRLCWNIRRMEGVPHSIVGLTTVIDVTMMIFYMT
jgi:hypothetical protein